MSLCVLPDAVLYKSEGEGGGKMVALVLWWFLMVPKKKKGEAVSYIRTLRESLF